VLTHKPSSCMKRQVLLLYIYRGQSLRHIYSLRLILINLKFKVMWYNRIVMDSNNNIIIKERIFIKDELVGGDSFGMDVLGNWVEEWWD
jgi:hypothetical protein